VKATRKLGPETDLILAQKVDEAVQRLLVAQHLHQQSSDLQQQLHRTHVQRTAENSPSTTTTRRCSS